MAKTETLLWDAADHLKTEEDMTAYLEAALEDGDPVLVAAVLDDIARAGGYDPIVSTVNLEPRMQAALHPLTPRGDEL